MGVFEQDMPYAVELLTVTFDMSRVPPSVIMPDCPLSVIVRSAKEVVLSLTCIPAPTGLSMIPEFDPEDPCTVIVESAA